MMNRLLKVMYCVLIFISLSGVLLAKKAPDFTYKDLKGKEISLSDFKGKVVIINFWATWCGPCIYEMPSLEKLNQQYKKDGVQIIGLTIQSNNNQVPKIISQTGVTYPILLDADEATISYGPFNAIPQTFIINRKGEIVQSFMGMRSYAQFEAEIKKIL